MSQCWFCDRGELSLRNRTCLKFWAVSLHGKLSFSRIISKDDKVFQVAVSQNFRVALLESQKCNLMA